MRLLILIPHPLLPIDRGNKQHTFNLLRHIARRHHCDLIGFNEAGRSSPTVWQELQALCPEVNLVGVVEQVKGWRLLFERVHCVLTLRPPALARYRNPEVGQLIESLSLHKYDVVLFDMYVLAEWRRFCASRPCVLIASDAYSLADFRAARDARTLRTRVRRLIDGALQLLLEKREYPRFDAVSTVSETAAEWLRKIAPRGLYHFVPVSVNEALLEPGVRADPGSSPPILLCWEGVSHEPVATKVDWFLRQVWPSIRRAVPQAEMVVWGDRPQTFLQRTMAQTAGVRHIGFAEDWIATLRSAAVFVFPHRATAGLHVKLMSAFAIGLPVVATREAYGWFPFSQGRNAYVAEHAQDFADRCIELLSDAEKRDRMGTEARDMMRELFRSERIASRMIAVLEEAASAHSRR
jgi:polysaccharide biosynthesis protein PslH